MRRVGIAAFVTIAGCAEGTEGPAESTAEPTLGALAANDHVDGLAREPMIVEAGDGTLFVTGYGEERPTLWRSGDGGATWDAVDVGDAAAGAVGNSDVDLAVAPDGTLYFVAMSFDRQAFEGTGIAVASSRDGGGTWTWTDLSRDRFDDRPWVEVAPDGTAHVIWNDGAGVRHAVSGDSGATWLEREPVHGAGGSSHLAIGPDGTIAVRVTPLSASGNRFDPDADHLAISTDGGATWMLRSLPGERTWSTSFDPREGVLRWVEPLAWDSAGALYSLSSEGTTLWLARSEDAGASWSRWPVAEGGDSLYFPYLSARGDGTLAATWFSSWDDSLRAHVAYIEVPAAADGALRIARSTPLEIPAFAFESEGTGAPPARDTAGEYIPALFLRDGRLAVVTTIQDPAQDRFGFTFRAWRVEGATRARR